MKTRLSVLALLMALAIPLLAQEEPIPPRRTKLAKVGLFGGFTPGVLCADMKPINDYLKGAGAAPVGENGIFMYGGGGAIYIMLLPNVRVGGVGMSGSLSSSAMAGTVRKDADISVGFGGVTFEYVINLAPRFDVAFGTMIGGGGIDITLRQDVGGNKTWFQEWSSFGSGNYETAGQVNNVEREMSGSFLVLIPSVNFEYALTGWLGVRLGASYVSMSAPSWSLDATHDLVGVPSAISGKGFMINAGLFLGTY
jgi:hypothetical protein